MNKYKVIIVDDDDVALENLTFELSKDVRFSLEKTARNGKQAKKVITKVQPDLLFLDVGNAGYDGYGTAKGYSG